MNFHLPNKSLVASIGALCFVMGMFLLILFYYPQQESDVVQHTEDVQNDSLVEPYDPFDYTKAYRNVQYNQVRIDYLVTPNKDAELVLKKIEEITDREGVFIGEDITILSDSSGKRGVSGDVYQIQMSDDVFSMMDALTRALGRGTDVGWVYIRPHPETSPSESYEHKVRLYDAQGHPFFAIQKRNGNVSDIVYSEKELPDFVLKLLETYNAGSLFDIYAHLQNGVLIVGERGIGDVGTLHIYTIDGETMQNIFSHTYDSLGDFVFLESPDQTKIAISFWKEGTGSSSFVNQSIIFDLEKQNVVSVPTLKDNLFPTFWANNNELTYGTAAGKDCGYYPHLGHFNISQNQFTFADTAIDYHFEKYLDSYIDRDGVGYRLFDVADESKYLSSGICGGGLNNKIIGLSESGVAEELYEVSDGEYILALGYVDENNLLFFVYPVLETTSDGRFVQKTGTPSARLLNKETKQITLLTHSELQELFEKAQQEDFIVREDSAIVLDSKNLDLDYITYILLYHGSSLDMFEQPTSVDFVGRNESGYFVVGKKDDRYGILKRALDFWEQQPFF